MHATSSPAGVRVSGSGGSRWQVLLMTTRTVVVAPSCSSVFTTSTRSRRPAGSGLGGSLCSVMLA